jgi:hypothetical protein
MVLRDAQQGVGSMRKHWALLAVITGILRRNVWRNILLKRT